MAVCHRPAAEILVAVPTRGQVGWATVTRLQEIRDRERGLAPILYQPGHLSVAATRNRLAGSWKVLVMVDDDVVPDARMLQLVDLIPEYGIAAAPTLVAINGKLGVNAYGADGREVRGQGVTEVIAVGFGCVAIDRELVHRGQPFELGYRDGQAVSDDVMFCEKARAAGARVAADFRIACDHHTSVSLAALAGLGG